MVRRMTIAGRIAYRAEWFIREVKDRRSKVSFTVLRGVK